jgi:hypothetical protein
LERIVHQRIKEHMQEKQMKKESVQVKKAPKKRVEYSDSDSEEPEVERKHKPNWGRSAQNKKSTLKVHNKPNVNDYFCD